MVTISYQWQSSCKRLCSSGLANATEAKMERYLTGYPGPGIGERYMWFWAAGDGPILPEGVPGPMPGPAPGKGGPGPIAPPPPPVGAAWKPPLAAISSLNVAGGCTDTARAWTGVLFSTGGLLSPSAEHHHKHRLPMIEAVVVGNWVIIVLKWLWSKRKKKHQ